MEKTSELNFKLITLENYREEIRGYVDIFKLDGVDITILLNKITSGLAAGMTSYALSRYCSEVSAVMITQNNDYGKLASVILSAYHTSVTLPSFSEKCKLLNYHNGNWNKEIYELIVKNAEIYDNMIEYSRDFELSYFAIHSLMKSYELRIEDTPIERPQDIFMRVAVHLQRDNFENVKKTYDLISQGYYTHATPTMFNACLKKCQLASCFLLTPKGDDIQSIYETIGDTALISKHSGGIGLNLHEIRSAGSPLISTGGYSKGIVPIIRIINESSKYVNQGGIKRNSSVAFYLEPWHKDIMAFLDLRKNTGPEELRARDIFIAIWMNDLFMERVEADGEWSLFDPNQAKGLHEVWGEEFREKYLRYERTISRTVIRAQTLWQAIVIAQIETGTPYIVYKDTCNRLSNQNHLGTIKCSNLCAEIIQYSSKNETSVCNLASICLPKYVKDGIFDFQALRKTVHLIVENLNNAIDMSFYPIPEAKRSNLLHRPMGIGVQGLADTFAILRYPFESQKARKLNKLIFETMYYSAIEASAQLASVHGPHETFMGSNLSKGIFQWQLTDKTPSCMWDWDYLRELVLKYGTRNSLFIAPMPTAGTSQIFGNTECFEPFTSNLFTRRTLAGEFQVANKYLVDDLLKIGLWSNEMRNVLLEFDGSIQNIPGIPQELKDLYKTIWEIKMKSVIEMAADRQPFVDQSQSLNIYMQEATYQKITSMHFYGWKNGLKTGMYYLRTKPITAAAKFTVDQELLNHTLSSLHDYESSKGGDQENNNNGTCESCSC